MHTVEKYLSIIRQFKNIKIAVLGDFILDKYILGDCTRISPEAPIPIVKVTSTMTKLGGAGNVAANLSGLNCNVDAYGLVGKDIEGKELINLLKQGNINSFLLQSVNNKKTIVKTRIIAQKQQVVRVDEEDNKTISIINSQLLLKKLVSKLELYDALIISDYAKGVLVPELTKQVISIFRNKNKLIIVDPKGINYNKYSNATTISPNFNEFKIANNNPNIINEINSLEKYAHKLKTKLNLDGMVITLGKDGVFIQNPSGKYNIIPTRAKDVFDVSGAGDTFVALFTASLLIENDWFIAGEIANYGAGIVVSKTGTSSISENELINVIKSS